MLVTAVTLAGCGQRGSENPTTGASTGVTTESHGDLTAAAEAMTEAGAVAVTVDARAGGQVQQLALGAAEAGRDAEIDDPARVASISKSVIATLVMQAVQDGAIALDDPVSAHLPDLLGDNGDVTVSELLSHSSGLPDYLPVLTAEPAAVLENGGRVWTPEELVAVALEQEWPEQPEPFGYSNTGYVVLGLILEQVSGSSVAELAQDRVFGPLGMADTFFPTDAELPDDALHGYLDDGETRHDVTGLDPSILSFAASLVSTSSDLSLFFAALAGGDLVSEESLQAMVDAGASTGYGYGLIIGADPCGGTVIGQRGNGFGYHAAVTASIDGDRVVSVVWTDAMLDVASDPLLPLSNELAVTALGSSC